MRFLLRFGWPALLILSAATVQAEVPREDVHALMERNGMAAQLADEADQLREMLPDAMEGVLPPDLVQPMVDTITAAWEDGDLLGAIEAALAATLTAEGLAAANAFANSPLGKRVAAAETDS